MGYNYEIKNLSGSLFSQPSDEKDYETEIKLNNFIQWFVGFVDVESCFIIKKSSK
jgi:hypothetical protein